MRSLPPTMLYVATGSSDQGLTPLNTHTETNLSSLEVDCLEFFVAVVES